MTFSNDIFKFAVTKTIYILVLISALTNMKQGLLNTWAKLSLENKFVLAHTRYKNSFTSFLKSSIKFKLTNFLQHF